MNKLRIKHLNEPSYSSGKIVYWMSRDQRVNYNWAFLHAWEIAKVHNAELEVVFSFKQTLLKNPKRHYVFMLENLKLLSKELADLGVKFTFIEESPEIGIVNYCRTNNCGYLVTDFSPLRNKRSWESEILKNLSVPFDVVDTHNIVPVWATSGKQEFGAHTLRPKLHKLLPKFLDEFVLDNYKKDISTPHQMILRKFLNERIQNYDQNRNDPNEDAQSNLSPYLHFGIISAQEVAIETIKLCLEKNPNFLHSAFIGKMTSDTLPSEEAFLEELIVRKELADNFCYYNSNYDNFDGLPNWAKETLTQHENDKREFLYDYEQFENSKTHDELWNAAQNELVKTGKMHGYMRMYWAKKILEWTKTAKDAIEIGIKLNDKFEIDGRDPNGYVGVLWSVGGLHDRPWFEREVFGKIRFMNRSGCERKFDVERYIKRWA